MSNDHIRLLPGHYMNTEDEYPQQYLDPTKDDQFGGSCDMPQLLWS